MSTDTRPAGLFTGEWLHDAPPELGLFTGQYIEQPAPEAPAPSVQTRRSRPGAVRRGVRATGRLLTGLVVTAVAATAVAGYVYAAFGPDRVLVNGHVVPRAIPGAPLNALPEGTELTVVPASSAGGILQTIIPVPFDASQVRVTEPWMTTDGARLGYRVVCTSADCAGQEGTVTFDQILGAGDTGVTIADRANGALSSLTG